MFGFNTQGVLVLRYIGLETFGIGIKVFFLEKDVIMSLHKILAEKFENIIKSHLPSKSLKILLENRATFFFPKMIMITMVMIVIVVIYRHNNHLRSDPSSGERSPLRGFLRGRDGSTHCGQSWTGVSLMIVIVDDRW